jgi:hypothetical protein
MFRLMINDAFIINTTLPKGKKHNVIVSVFQTFLIFIVFAKCQKLFDLFQVHQVLRLQIQQSRSRVLGQGPLQRRHSA